MIREKAFKELGTTGIILVSLMMLPIMNIIGPDEGLLSVRAYQLSLWGK